MHRDLQFAGEEFEGGGGGMGGLSTPQFRVRLDSLFCFFVAESLKVDLIKN